MKCNKPSLILFLFVSFIYSPGCGRAREREGEEAQKLWEEEGSEVAWRWEGVLRAAVVVVVATPYRQLESPCNKVFLSRNVLLISTETERERVWGGVR